MPIVRITLPAEKRALREKMRALGLGHREIAAEFARRYRLRPRAAWREAHGWSLREAAALLACVYGCAAADLIDLADREQLPPAELLILDTYGQEIPNLRNENRPSPPISAVCPATNPVRAASHHLPWKLRARLKTPCRDRARGPDGGPRRQ